MSVIKIDVSGVVRGVDEGVSESEAAERLETCRRRLSEVRAGAIRAEATGATGSGDVATGPVEAVTESVGVAGDGAVRAVAGCGRLRSVSWDPYGIPRDEGEFADLIRAAVNSALDAARLAAREAVGPVVDLAALSDGLRDVQDQGVRTMWMINGVVVDAMARVR